MRAATHTEDQAPQPTASPSAARFPSAAHCLSVRGPRPQGARLGGSLLGRVIQSTRKTKVFMATMLRFGHAVMPMVGVLLILLYAFSVLAAHTRRPTPPPDPAAQCVHTPPAV